MVGKPGEAPPKKAVKGGRHADPEALAERLARLPALGRLRESLAGERAFLVGGAVRDVLLGLDHPDLDVAVDGDVAAVARRLGAQPLLHERFRTATVEVDDVRIDLAATRAERYPRPGALPEVERAALERDLRRRDFTVNAMAVPLQGESRLIDPHGGLADLRAGLLRVLHDESFSDDPTRALRAARYAARFRFELEPRTAELLAGADLGTVSDERVQAELRRTAAETTAPEAFTLLARWGLAGIDSGAGARIGVARDVLARPGWKDLLDPAAAAYALAVPDPALEAGAVRLSAASPERPSAGAKLAAGRSPQELVMARVAGAAWLDDYVRDWRHVRLEITGEDVIAAGVPEGPAVGRALAAALAAKLDGEAAGREAELRAALAAAS